MIIPIKSGIASLARYIIQASPARVDSEALYFCCSEPRFRAAEWRHPETGEPILRLETETTHGNIRGEQVDFSELLYDAGLCAVATFLTKKFPTSDSLIRATAHLFRPLLWESEDCERFLVSLFRALRTDVPPDLLEQIEQHYDEPEAPHLFASERFLRAMREWLIFERPSVVEPLPEPAEASSEIENGNLTRLRPLSEWLAERGREQVGWLPVYGREGLLARGAFHLLIAPPKAGKSLWLIHAIRGWLQNGLKVAIVSEEPALVWQQRVERFPELSSLIVGFAHESRHPAAWVESLVQVAPDVAIFDTLRAAGFLPNDENDAGATHAFVSHLLALRNRLPKTALIACHHARKSDGENPNVQSAAGSHALAGCADALFAIQPKREAPRVRVLVPLAGRIWAATPPPACSNLLRTVPNTYHWEPSKM